jgi:hypothetical protein
LDFSSSSLEASERGMSAITRCPPAAHLCEALVVCRYIHQKPCGGVHEYLCNRLVDLPDESVERILSQLCELAVNGNPPSTTLQRTLVGLAGRSLRNALKVLITSMVNLFSFVSLKVSGCPPLRAQSVHTSLQPQCKRFAHH